MLITAGTALEPLVTTKASHPNLCAIGSFHPPLVIPLLHTIASFVCNVLFAVTLFPRWFLDQPSLSLLCQLCLGVSLSSPTSDPLLTELTLQRRAGGCENRYFRNVWPALSSIFRAPNQHSLRKLPAPFNPRYPFCLDSNSSFSNVKLNRG